MAQKEQLADVVDHLLRETLAASTARESHRYLETRKHCRAAATLLELAQELLQQVDDNTKQQQEPEIRSLAAALALVNANLHAGERTLEHNRLAYQNAIELTADLPSDFEGRARSSFGAVLMYFRQWNDAVSELQLARQCLHTPGLLAPWALTTCRLATVYWELGRVSDSMRVLREITSALVMYRSQHLSPYHLSAAILMVRLLWRRGRPDIARQVARQATDKLRQQRTLLDSPEFAALKTLTTIRGIVVYELRMALARRTLDL